MSEEGPPMSAVMEVSTTYSQVVFSNVPQSYPLNTSIKCSYTVTALVQPHCKDWIGIFKVGWSTTRDYYSFAWVTSCDQAVMESANQHVIFDAYYLPKEDGEFYQFCYVDSSGLVRGVSTPFLFESPVENSLEFKFENDMVVITTQDQMEQMTKEKGELYKEVAKHKEVAELLRGELDERLLEIRRLRESNAEFRESVDKLKQDIQKETERECEQAQLAIYEKSDRAELEKERQGLFTLNEQPTQIIELRKEKEELQHSLSTMQEKHEQAVAKINKLKHEREELKARVKAQQSEIIELNSRFKDLEQKSQEKLCRLQDKTQLLQVDLQGSQRESLKLSRELFEFRAQMKGVNEVQCMSLLKQTQQEEAQEQCKLVAGKHQEVNVQLQQELNSSMEASQRVDKTQQDLEAKIQLEQMSKSLEERMQMNSELEFELRETRRCINEQASLIKMEKEELSHENQRLRSDIQKLNEELTHRQVSPPPASISLHYPNPYSSSHVLSSNSFETPDFRNPEVEALLEQHERSHKICPFCSLNCDSLEQSKFEEHVYCHEE